MFLWKICVFVGDVVFLIVMYYLVPNFQASRNPNKT